MKASEQQIRLAEEISFYIKNMVMGNDFDSPTVGSDVIDEVVRLSEKYELDTHQEESLSDAFIDICFAIRSLKS